MGPCLREGGNRFPVSERVYASNVSIFKVRAKADGRFVGEDGEIFADHINNWVMGSAMESFIDNLECILPSAMEKNTPTLALKTNANDERLRQLEWQGRLISRFLMALRLTARILTFTSSFGPNVFVC